MRAIRWSLALALAASGGALAVAKPAPKPAARPAAAAAPATRGGPVTYWMSAATVTGMGGGGAPSMAAMMSGGFNPSAVSHTLLLQLGSPRRPAGEPSAEHLPPRELGAGPSLPLVTPVSQPRQPAPPGTYERPNGRMLIFWGCGEHAGAGQPVVVDFARLGAAQGGQQMASLMSALGTLGGSPPSAARYATYGEWPNERGRTTVPGEGSLQGGHLVRGNYTPDIAFTMTAEQDFLPPFQLTSNTSNPSGSASLGWRRVDGAIAYFATLMGSGGDNTVVMWSSSQVQASGFGLPEYLTSADVSRLLANHVLMTPAALSCTVPAEAVRAAGQGGFFTLNAYGDEANFAFPPRPADPRTAWAPQWTVKVRYRSTTSGMLGMNMSEMGGSDDGEGSRRPQGQPQQQPKPRRPGGFLGGLGNIVP